MIKRISLAVRYDGSQYHGWQSQDEVVSVQQCVERALSRVANQSISVVCAGRTDAGVHATAQVIHFDTEVDRTEQSWVFGANSNLPADITILWAKIVDRDFHARFSAKARTYKYVILNQDVRPGILRKAVSWHYKPLDVDLMQKGARHLLGEHDFNAYRGAACQAKHPVRTIYRLDVAKRGRMVVFEVKANAFLMHMVRNIVGVLVAIGEGVKAPEWALEVLNSRDRRCGGVTIGPNGLYLVSIDYPDEFNLPKMPTGPFFLS